MGDESQIVPVQVIKVFAMPPGGIRGVQRLEIRCRMKVHRFHTHFLSLSCVIDKIVDFVGAFFCHFWLFFEGFLETNFA